MNHLHRAVRDGDWNEVIHILDKGADVNVKDDNGVSVLGSLFLPDQHPGSEWEQGNDVDLIVS